MKLAQDQVCPAALMQRPAFILCTSGRDHVCSVTQRCRSAGREFTGCVSSNNCATTSPTSLSKEVPKLSKSQPNIACKWPLKEREPILTESSTAFLVGLGPD